MKLHSVLICGVWGCWHGVAPLSRVDYKDHMLHFSSL